MSIYPCATDGKRIAGPASSIYAWASLGSWSARKRTNYCSSHINQAVQQVDAGAELVYIGEVAQIDLDNFPRACSVCGLENDLYTLYVDIFQRGEDRRTYRARLCDEHLRAQALSLSLDL